MGRIILMRGLPGSGKSTRAKELMTSVGNAIRVNKDLLREMLFFSKFTGYNEGQVRDAERAIATHYLAEGKVVIVDDTNLGNRHLESWKSLGYPIEVELVDTPVEVCIERDRDREKLVGRSVIMGMARQYGFYKPSKREVIVDIDGTVADATHRLHFVQQQPKQWDEFFKAMILDAPRREVIEEVLALATDYEIVFVSGRPDTYRKETENWLKQHIGLLDATVLMRKGTDKRPDDQVKQDILDTYFDKSNIELVIDDRPAVIRMWRENGLQVKDVGDGREF